MQQNPVILWFRQDLRLADNPALTAAAAAGRVLPIYILDDGNAGAWKLGAASRCWLHHSLADLKRRTAGALRFFKGDATVILPDLITTTGARTVCWNRCYEPWRIKRDSFIKEGLERIGCRVVSCNGSLLWEPWQVLKKDATPYKVFTPYFRNGCLGAATPSRPVASAGRIDWWQGQVDSLALEQLQLLPQHPWQAAVMGHCSVGEQEAALRLEHFLEQGLVGYREGRDYPARAQVSGLSPHLHFGEISPRQVWYGAMAAGHRHGCIDDLDHFLSELAWREFSYYLLYHFPRLPEACFNGKFDTFPWTDNARQLAAWQRGETGYPIVDAGMRQLWQTGTMHNRVRMIVASFLVKNQLVDWRLGQRWFWDCLLDADLASNSFGWQWVAGCGADAAPYFRIFNPVTQGEKFDADGKYLRRFVPELARLPDKYLHQPWTAPESVLAGAGVRLGENYPLPVVDLKASREAALAAYQRIR